MDIDVHFGSWLKRRRKALKVKDLRIVRNQIYFSHISLSNIQDRLGL